MKSHLEQKMLSNGAVGKNEVVSDEYGSCTLCGSKSVCKCQRCGDFYCSPQCQRKDWSNHRYICFPMPPLVKASNWSPVKDNEIVEGKIPFLQCQTQNKSVPKEEKQIDVKVTHPEGTKIPTSESCVVLTSFKSTNRCYIRSTNPSDEENYKRILKEIDDFGKTAPSVFTKPKFHSYALASKDGKWCRVQIIGNVTEKHIRVQFVDYGEISKRLQNDFRQIHNRLISLPCYVHLIQLKDIKLVSFQTQFINSLSKYTNQEYKLVLEKKDKSGGDAKLFNWKTKALLNTEIDKLCCKLSDETNDITSNVSSLSNEPEDRNGLEKMTSNKSSHQENVKIGKANSPETAKTENEKKNSPGPTITTQRKTIQKPHQIQALKPCLEPPFKICPLNENDKNSKVIITDDSFAEVGYIGCLLEKYCENLKEVATFLKEHRVNDQPYKPKFEEYCLAEFEKEWYRAKVVEIISDDKYRVVYIDFTNEMELTSKSIRRYPMSLTVPCHTTLCAVDGLPGVLSEKLKDFLKSECTAFGELHIDNIRMDEDVCYVESKELLKKLHDEKF